MKGYMKTILSTVLCYLMIISMLPLSSVTAVAAVSYTGSGTESNPFVVSTGAELISVFTNYKTEDVYIELDNNITLDETYVPGNFSGHFDGNFYKITAKTHFLHGNSGTIKNFYFTNTVTRIDGDASYAGVLCDNNSGLISGVIATGNLDFSCIHTTSGDNDVSDPNDIGVIAGNNSGTIINCGAFGSIYTDCEYGSCAAGISPTGTVINCYVAAQVNAIGGSRYGSGEDDPIGFGSVTNSYYNNELYTYLDYGMTTSYMKTAAFVSLLNSNPVACDSKWIRDTSNKNSGYPILARALGVSITSSKTDLLINGTESVTLTCDDSVARIYYTLDGTTPTTASRLYSAPISISSETTITAVAYKNGVYSSPFRFQYAKVSGEGTAESPYIINSEASLRAVAELKKDTNNDAYYVVTKDIIMTGEMPHLGDFCGSFDGQGHTISNIFTAEYISGIFNKNYGVIENLNLKIKTGNRLISKAGIALYNYGAIYNCTVEGYLEGDSNAQNIGGITAYNYGRLENCSYDGCVHTMNCSKAGGIVGYNSGTVVACSFSGEVDVFAVSFGCHQGYVGGFVGYNEGQISGSVVNATSVWGAPRNYSGVYVGAFMGGHNEDTASEVQCAANVALVGYDHFYTEWGINATNDTYNIYKIYGGSVVLATVPDPHNHDFTFVIKPPVCGQLRSVNISCSCGISFTTEGYFDEYYNKKHSYEGVFYTETKAPTCTEKGALTRHCIYCNYADVLEVAEVIHGEQVMIDPKLYPESAHNYESNTDDAQTFTQPGATQLHITFSSETYTYYSDCIYIYYLNDAGSRVCYGSYKYDELRSKTITVPGDTVEIRLTSDSSGESYGYSITSIYADMSSGGSEQLVDRSLYPESAHNYQNYANETKVFSYPGARELKVKFSSNTKVENNFDYIYIYDANGIQIGRYTGTTLAGATLTIPGNSFSIKLTSDYSQTYYGYSFTSIKATSGYGEWTVEYAPTCTENGLKAKICTMCNERVTEELPALGHTRETIPSVSATCTETGLTSGVKCSVCNEILSAQGVTSALGHNYVAEITTEATCTEDGVKTHTCSRCSDSYTEAIPMINHNIGKEQPQKSDYPESNHNYANNTNQSKTFIWPGATQLKVTFSTSTKLESNYDYIYLYDGNNNQIGKYTGTTLAGVTITIPGDTFTIKLTSDSSNVYYGYAFTSIVAEFSGGYGDWFVATEPSCVEPGVEKRVCSLCNYEDIKEIPATGHTHVPVTTDPTCTTAGKIEYTCHCGDAYSEVINATGHNLEYYSVDSTSCIDIGYECYKCTDCGEEYGKSFYDPLDHTAGEWEIVVAATCTEDGYRIKKCTVCEIELEREGVSATGHSHEGEVISAPTCTDDGLKCYTCSACGDSYDEVLSAFGHSYEEEIVAEATCIVDGIKRYTCSVCSDSYDEILPAIGHSETTVRTEPTCSANGSIQHLCEHCGEELAEAEILPMLPHTYEETVISEPTCVADGKKCYICSVCADSYDEILPATGEHTIKTIRKEPTCTKIGTEQYICEVCGNMIGDLIILPKVSHTYGEWTLISAPTETTEGSKQHSCEICGKSETVKLPVLSFDTAATVAIDYSTNMIAGFGAGSASVEDYISIESYTWSYETQNGRLGTGSKAILKDENIVIAEYTILVYGDTNGDSWYDGQDAVLVSCLASGMLTAESVGEAAYMAADCNHDGVIDDVDIALLNEAGTLLSNVDQTMTSKVLFETSSAYIEYISLIDQSPEIEIEEEKEDIPEADNGTEDVSETDDVPAEDEETQVVTPEQNKAETGIFELIISFIRSIFEMFLHVSL